MKQVRGPKEIRRVIVHHSNTPDGVPHDPKLHERYHYIIPTTGGFETAVPLLYATSHLRKKAYDTIGVCLIGESVYTKPQAISIMKLFFSLRRFFGILQKDWFTHNSFEKVECPGFSGDFLNRFLSVNTQNIEVQNAKSLDRTYKKTIPLDETKSFKKWDRI